MHVSLVLQSDHTCDRSVVVKATHSKAKLQLLKAKPGNML